MAKIILFITRLVSLKMIISHHVYENIHKSERIPQLLLRLAENFSHYSFTTVTSTNPKIRHNLAHARLSFHSQFIASNKREKTRDAVVTLNL